jgi:hypothetical protein
MSLCDANNILFDNLSKKIIIMSQFHSTNILLGEKTVLSFTEIENSLKEIIIKILNTEPEKFQEYYICMIKQIWYTYLDAESKEIDIIKKNITGVGYHKIMNNIIFYSNNLRKFLKKNKYSMSIEQLNMLDNLKNIIMRQKTLLFTLQLANCLTKELVDYYC